MSLAVEMAISAEAEKEAKAAGKVVMTGGSARPRSPRIQSRSSSAIEPPCKTAYMHHLRLSMPFDSTCDLRCGRQLRGQRASLLFFAPCHLLADQSIFLSLLEQSPSPLPLLSSSLRLLVATLPFSPQTPGALPKQDLVETVAPSPCQGLATRFVARTMLAEVGLEAKCLGMVTLMKKEVAGSSKTIIHRSVHSIHLDRTIVRRRRTCHSLLQWPPTLASRGIVAWHGSPHTASRVD